MIVIDCSALLDFLLKPQQNAAIAAAIESASSLSAPDLIDVEMINSLRRLENLRSITPSVAGGLVEQFLLLPLDRYPVHELVGDIWGLRKNFSAYDACYVALARSLKVPLLTSDRGLRRAVAQLAKIALI